MKYRVILECDASVWAEALVDADSEDDARKVAMEIKRRDLEWQIEETQVGTKRVFNVEAR